MLKFREDHAEIAERYREKYPFIATTNLVFPRPEDINPTGPIGHFVRLVTRDKKAVWFFKTEDNRLAFLEKYTGVPLETMEIDYD